MSIKQRAETGKWRVRVYVGRDPSTGRRLYREVTCATKKEARDTEARIIHELRTGAEVDAKRLTVSDYMTRWLDAKGQKTKRRTKEGYEQIVRCHVLPVIGSLQLSKLRPLHVEKVLTTARARGLSERTLLHIHRCLFTACRQAVRWQLLARNPVEAVEAPKPKTKRVAALEQEDAQLILKSVADSDLEMPTILALGTGMRLGEVMGLRWSDVDLDEGHAYIAQVLQVDGSFDTPKTHRSSRAVALPTFVVAALRVHRKAQTERRLVCGGAWQNLDLVHDRGDGKPVDPRSMSRRFRSAMDAAGLDLTFHGLRHGYATLALSAGVDLKITQGMLGHSSFGITADLYSHVSERADTAAASKVGALLWPETGTVTPLR